LTEVYQIQSDFEERVEAEFERMVAEAMGAGPLVRVG
jgi:hypothetical protein